jgi:hypothetical protein
MFVLEALLLTFMTTPLVTTFYPLAKRKRVAAGGANFEDVADEERRTRSRSRNDNSEVNHPKTRFTVVLDKIDHLPSMMAVTQILVPTPSNLMTGSCPLPHQTSKPSLDALRLIELSDRTSAVMKSSVADTLLLTDPLLAIFRMFGELHGLPVSTSLSIVPYDDLAHVVTDHARSNFSELIFVPWLPPIVHDMAETGVGEAPTTPKLVTQTTNPFDALFRSGHSIKERSAPAVHAQFVRGIFSQSKTDVALFIDQGHQPGAIDAQHVFLPFFGGPDDRLALEFVVQLCANPKITASVVKVTKQDDGLIRETQPVHSGTEKVPDSHPVEPEHHFTVTSVRLFSPQTSISVNSSHIIHRLPDSRIQSTGKPLLKRACNQKLPTVLCGPALHYIRHRPATNH